MNVATLEQVDHQIARGHRWLRFAPVIEAAFLREYLAARVRLAGIWAVIGTVIYDLVYFGDGTMMADVFSELVIVRFFIFTPFVIASVFAIRRWPRAWFYDLLAMAIALLGVGLPMSCAVFSNSPHMFVYQNGNVAAFLFFAIALRPRFATIFAGLAAMCAVHFTLVHLTGAFDAATFTAIVTFYVTVSVFLALSAYFMEHKDRLTFLHQLRGNLLHAELAQKAERDDLTGLLNRHSLTRMRQMAPEKGLGLEPVSAIMLDIDHFKLFNDVHGHIAGDACIRSVSDCIAAHVSDKGQVFRFGGEEILVLMPETDRLRALAMAEHIRAGIEALSIRHRGKGEDAVVTASLGVATSQGAAETIEDILKRADSALYEAKRRGRNTVMLADWHTNAALDGSDASTLPIAALARAG